MDRYESFNDYAAAKHRIFMNQVPGDLAVLNADYLTVPEDQIRTLQSLLTMVGGRVVYTAGPFAQLERK